jgi:hypothetical protein
MRARILILMAAVMAIVIVWIVVACQTTQDHNVKRVVIENDRIVLNAVTLSQSDEAAFNRILKQYDKSLYRVETYEKGRLTKTRGRLGEMQIQNEVASKAVDAAKQEGFSQYAMQLWGVPHNPTPTPGATSGVGHHPTPTPGATWGVGHTTPTPGAATGADEFVQRLKPILEKYAR